jgi:hypothetical protein
MRWIGQPVLVIVLLLVAPFDAVAGKSTKVWYLMEPPVDETSNVSFGVLDQAPLGQWKRIATYETEAACEYKRNEAVQRSVSRQSPRT